MLRHLLSAIETVEPRRAFAAAIVLALIYGVTVAVLRLLPLNDALMFGLMLVSVVLLLSRCDQRRRGLGVHAVSQIIILSGVLSVWLLGYEGRSALFGGILPWSDSFDYTNDALRLVHGHALVFGAKRPLYPVALAALLRVFDLRLVLVLFAAFIAWAVALATNTVWTSHGRRAALVIFALLLFSARHWAGFVQTEDIGLPMGLIGFVLLWRVAGGEADRRLALLGIMAITMALMARAGAFFILPALALWTALTLPPGAARWRWGFYAIGAIFCGVAVHETVLHIAASGVSFSDYPPIVYGLIHHRDFTYLAEQHPEVVALSGAAKTATLWRIVVDEALMHPLLLLAGLLRSFAELFYTPNGLFGFVWRNPDDVIFENGAALRAAFAQYGLIAPPLYWVQTRGLYSLCNGIAMGVLGAAFVGVTITALIALYRRPPDRYAMLLRYAIGGVLLSAPFTPPWITNSHQIEVATLAFMAAIPALWRGQPGRIVMARTSGALAAVPLVFAACVILAAVLLVHFPVRPPACVSCRAMRVYPGTLVRVTPSRSFTLQDRAEGDLRTSLLYLAKHNRELTDSLTPHLRPGTVYALAYDAKAGAAKIVVDDRGLITAPGWQDIQALPLATPLVLHVTAVAALH